METENGKRNEIMTDLNKPFLWGLIIEDIEVGPYTVRSFHPEKFDQNCYGSGFNRTDVIHYHGYIDGKSCNESWLTLDDALVGMIARRIERFTKTESQKEK